MNYLFFTFLLFSSSNTKAQSCDGFNLGTKTLYKFPEKKQTPAPAGYVPVFINHVGRHGARHLTKEVTTSFAYKLIAKADSLRGLSSKGARLKKIIYDLEAVEKGKVKSISYEGKEEQIALAQRMCAAYPGVFYVVKDGYAVMITKEIRTKQTADAFLLGLKMVNTVDNKFSYVVNDTILRFYDLSPAYLSYEEKGDWKKSMDGLKAALNYEKICVGVAGSFFVTPFLKTLSTVDKETFTSDLFGFLTILSSIKKEVDDAHISLTPDSLKQFFACDQLAAVSKIDNAEDYLLKGPGTNKEGIQVKIAAPLLVDFINATDAYLQDGKESVKLRFTHAEAVAPFAALLGLQGADKGTKDLANLDKTWKAAEVVPLSANVQWVVYKNKEGNCLLKFLLNEKETSVIGLKTKSFPYYNWDDVRSFYTAKLQRLHLGYKDSLHQYLLAVQ